MKKNEIKIIAEKNSKIKNVQISNQNDCRSYENLNTDTSNGNSNIIKASDASRITKVKIKGTNKTVSFKSLAIVSIITSVVGSAIWYFLEKML